MKKTLLLISVLSVGACAYAIDGNIQDVKFITPGAKGAACNVYVEGLKYRTKPPQTLTLYKSKEDLVVDCMAPGNRRKTVYIKPTFETSAAWNAANAGAGLPWDYLSASLFRYPDTVEVNFTDTPVIDPPPPAQNNPDIRQPEDYMLEEFSPGTPRMNEDRYAPPVEIKRRESTMQSAVISNNGSAFSDSTSASGGKSDLMNVFEDLGASMNPASDRGVSTPIPLVPGE